jgi:hypothetical protein
MVADNGYPGIVQEQQTYSYRYIWNARGDYPAYPPVIWRAFRWESDSFYDELLTL